MDFNVYADEMGLDNPELARRLLKAIILPKDWEVIKTRRLEDVVPSMYQSFLKFIHEIFLIEESISWFANLNRSLYDQLESAKAENEVAEELKQALECKLENSVATNFSLEKELKVAQAKVAELEAKLKKKKLRYAKVLIKEGLQKSNKALA